MKCITSWSFDRYRPAVCDGDHIYICQIIPGVRTIKLVWKGPNEPADYKVNYRKKDNDEAWAQQTAHDNHIVLEGLDDECDYEFTVVNDRDRSAVGFARTGFVPGTVVNYLHSDDPKYSFSGQHVCTPSLLVHPDGYMLASMDIFDGRAPQNLTLIFRSDDNGDTWYHYSELFPCFWGNLFYHRGDVYMLSTSTEYGDLLIGKSTDGGKTFGMPTVLTRGSCHFATPGWHKSAMPIVEAAGRLWTAVDYGSHKSGTHASALLSVSSDADLLDVASWAITDPLSYSPDWEGAVKGDNRGFIEGNAVVMPDGGICNILRYSTNLGEPRYGLIGMLRGDVKNPEASLTFEKFVKFPGNLSKFDIVFDSESGYYFTIFSRIKDDDSVGFRNLLSLAATKDLENWQVLQDLHDYSHLDPKKVGFQYVSMKIEGSDIIYLSRTAFNMAQSFHDNNYITFHRISSFRNLL